MRRKMVRRLSALTMLTVVAALATAVFLFILFGPTLAWQLSPFREMNIWTIEKTVPYPDYREHAGFFWILKNEKISKPGAKQLYSENSDYFGFYPYGENEWRSVSLPTSGPRPDLIYVTDTYGVYKDDYMQKKLSGELSKMIYGGLSMEDIGSIRQNLGEGNVFIAEFNTAASPTNIRDRTTLGNLLGLNWSGWIGKYFEDLSRGKEIPPWVIVNYEAQRGKKWNYFGRGFVLISENDEVEVLTGAEDMGPGGLTFAYDERWGETLHSRKPVSYRYWFEWTKPDPGTEVVANYNLDLKPSGLAKLKALGLPAMFPAVLKSANTQYTGWYFAGDFADLKLSGTPFRRTWISFLKKLLVDDSADSNVFFFWKAYVPLMRSILQDAEAARKARRAVSGKSGEPKLKVRAFGDGFQLRDGEGAWKPFFVRGVNMGLAQPGKYFTDFPDSVSVYLRWLDGIADMNANTVRVYTLPPPEFYKALLIHNTEKPEKTLFLLQEIWPEENPPNGDYLASAYRQSYLKEMDYGIDAIYGRANVPERKGRAWGIYTADVSPWLLGWLVGRELESAEVLETNARNKGAAYNGKYVSAGTASSPTEVWLAESLDEVATIEAARYGALHPVAIVSWPTLDPTEHESEWDPATGKKNKVNDRASVAIDHLEISHDMTAGLFGAYHIYPNYPDFINNEAAYGSYRDDKGVLRFGGYLSEFMKNHGRYPVLVAEFGLSNSSGIAHFAPDGMNQGGLDESSSGIGLLRMMDAIRREGCAGGVVTELMDEWVKKTWTTEGLMIPYDRHVLWHNVVDPGQNFGLMANEATPPAAMERRLGGRGAIDSLGLAADAEYLHISIALKRRVDFPSEEVLVGLDTFDRGAGQMVWPVGGLKTASGLEFVVRIASPEKAELLVIPSYNAMRSRYATAASRDGVFQRMTEVVNGAVRTRSGAGAAAMTFDASSLRRGPFDEAANLWNMADNRISLRIPWTYLNVTDPSSLTVLNDGRGAGTARVDLKTAKTDGIVADAIVWDEAKSKVAGAVDADPSRPYAWKGWETAPPFRERLKKSYYVLQKAWAGEADKGFRAQP
jgi:hypothetical protein